MNIKSWIIFGFVLFFWGYLSFSQNIIWLTENNPLQELIDSVAPGTTILVPPGEWREVIVIRKSLILQSMESENPFFGQIIIEGEEGIKVKLIGIKISNTESAGMIIRGEVAVEIISSDIEGNNSAGIWVENKAKVKVENSTFRRNGYGIFARDETKVVISESVFQNNKFGMWICGITTVFISGSDFSENSFSGISVHDSSKLFVESSVLKLNQNYGICAFDVTEITVTNSAIEKNKGGGIYLGGKAKAIISGNMICENQRFGIFSHSLYDVQGERNIIEGNLLELAGNLSAKLRVPRVLERKEKEIIFPGNFATLQEAIDALAPDGTIIFLPGRYKINGVIWKPLTLKGNDPETTIIEGTISLIEEAINVKIEGIKLLNSWDSGIITGGKSQVEINNVVIEASELHGISILGNSQVSLLYTSFVGNLYGIAVFHLGRVFVANSIFKKNSYGTCIFDFGKAEIFNSKYQNNEVDGIYIHDYALVLIKNSIIERNGGNGISIFGESQVLISDSKIRRNGERIFTRDRGHGILIGGSPTIILENNEISYNKYYGIYLQSCKEGSEFSGKICGKGNQIFWNHWGKTCPLLLVQFLREGNCYQPE